MEIETLKAEAEIEPLRRLTMELVELKQNGGKAAMDTYVRNAKLALFTHSNRLIAEVKS